MKKSQRNLMLLLLVVGVLVFGKGFGLFSIVDDYTTYYAFDGSSQAIADLQNVNTFKFNCLAGEYSPAYCGTICREPPYVYDISNPKGCSTSTFTSDCVGYSITYICSDDLFTIQTKTGYSASRSWETKIDTSGVMSFASDYVFNNLETASLPITLTKNMKGNYLKFLVTGRYVYDPKHNHYGGLLLSFLSIRQQFQPNVQNSFLIEVIPSSIDKDLVYVTLNGGEPVEYRITTPEWYPKITVIGSGVGGNAKLVYIKYKPQFGCEKSANEVVVRDKFASGSVYNIEDLTYKPSKICLALAPKIVSSTGVATDRFGEILSELSKGKDVAVVDGTYQIIDYITYYVNDMAERCDVNTVYDTETRRCETAETQIDTTDILKCSTKDDCLLPTKCTATATCNQGQCAYTSSVCSQEQVLNEVIVFKEMINGVIQYRQAQTLQNEFTGTGQFTFATGCTTQGKSRTICTENCFNIGDLQFCGSAPEFTCGLTSADQGSTNYGQQPNNCWMNSPSFAGSKLVLTKGVKTKVNDWLSVTWYPSGKGVRNNAIALPWSSGYIFEINMKDFFSISNDKNQNIFTILNQQKSAPFLVKNDIANFNAQQSGLKLITDATLLQQASVITYPKIAFTKGSNPYTAVIPTNQLGTLIISANPYIKIKADKEITMYDDETSFYAYNVVTEIPQNTNCNADVTYKCENGQTITIARCNSGNLEYTSSQCSPVILPWVDGFTFSDAMPFVIIGIVAVGGFVLLKKKRRR